jgi:hypothetical protein
MGKGRAGKHFCFSLSGGIVKIVKKRVNSSLGKMSLFFGLLPTFAELASNSDYECGKNRQDG